MRKRRKTTYDLGGPMSMGSYIKGFAFIVVFCSFLLALAWAAMSWVLGDRTPAIILLFILPLAIILLWRIGRSMPGLS